VVQAHLVRAYVRPCPSSGQPPEPSAGRASGSDYETWRKPIHCNSRAFADHVVIGPDGVVLVDSKRYAGRVWQGPDGRVWHNQSSMDRPLSSLRMQCAAVAELLGVPVRPLVCVHGARVDVAGLAAGEVEIIPARRLRAILTSPGPQHSGADVAALAAHAQAMLRPA
jgi:hypothetical protein